MQSIFGNVFSTAKCVFTSASILAGALLAGPAWADHDGRPVKIMIINMFGGPFPSEAAAFTGNLHLTETIHVRGLSPDYPNILCNSDGVCQMIAGEGHANATASTMALILSENRHRALAQVRQPGRVPGAPSPRCLGSGFAGA